MIRCTNCNSAILYRDEYTDIICVLCGYNQTPVTARAISSDRRLARHVTFSKLTPLVHGNPTNYSNHRCHCTQCYEAYKTKYKVKVS